jgi:hypothetical protein
MVQMRHFRVFGLAAIALVTSFSLAAQGDLTAIQQQLYKQFKLTATTADRSDIVTAGDVVVLHKPGLLMYAVASPMPPSNTYKNGRIGQGWGGFGKDLAISMEGQHRPITRIARLCPRKSAGSRVFRCRGMECSSSFTAILTTISATTRT